MNRKIKQRAFTLLELVVAMTIFFGIVTLLTSLFVSMIKTKGGLEARQHVIKESYFLIERIQSLAKNYRIDYEEYRNRKQFGCRSLSDKTWSTTGACTQFSAYGNSSFLDASSDWYYCTTKKSEVSESYVYSYTNCPQNSQQGYGQYRLMAQDVGFDVGGDLTPVGDDDDTDTGVLPPAIMQSTGVQELYLISHDGKQRLLFRRRLLEQGDRNKDGVTGTNASEQLYVLEMLQLKGLDVGREHDYTAPSDGFLDGKIDTRVCDSSLGYVCTGASIGGAYADYHLPIDANDGWVVFSPRDISISSRNLSLFPESDPIGNRNTLSGQTSPFLTLSLETVLYAKSWMRKLPFAQMPQSLLRLQTSLHFPVF